MAAEPIDSLLFAAAGRLWGLPLTSVSEVMRPRPLEHLPGLPDFVAGIARYRGEAAPVVCLAPLVDAGPSARRWIALRTDPVVLLAVDGVEGVAVLAATGAELPALLASCRDEYVEALGQLDQRLVAVLAAVKLAEAAGQAIAETG